MAENALGSCRRLAVYRERSCPVIAVIMIRVLKPVGQVKARAESR